MKIEIGSEQVSSCEVTDKQKRLHCYRSCFIWEFMANILQKMTISRDTVYERYTSIDYQIEQDVQYYIGGYTCSIYCIKIS